MESLFTVPIQEPGPKESPVRRIANIIAAILAIFGFGLEMEGSHPYIGILFMCGALLYGAWELFTSKAAIRAFPLPVRISFLLLLLAGISWVSWPHVAEIVKGTSRMQAMPPHIPTALEIADELSKRAPKPLPPRSHLVVTGQVFNIDTPTGNFANVFFKSTGELDATYREYCQFWAERTSKNQDEQREIENRLWIKLISAIPHLEAPSTEIPVSAEMYISNHMPPRWTAEQIRRSSLAIYYMGRFIYQDKNGKHQTDFCVYVRNKDEPVFECHGHNEAP